MTNMFAACLLTVSLFCFTNLSSARQVPKVPEKCIEGPEYWCQNLSTAQECKATQHCMDKVWSKLEPSEDNDVICTICSDMVEFARDLLENHEAEEVLKDLIEGSCHLIPIKIVAKECMDLADDFVPEILETLASVLNPQGVCSVVGLCNNARIDQLLDDYIARVPISHQANVRIMGTKAAAQLLIERMFLTLPVRSKPLCSFCQYFLHYLQVEISDIDNGDRLEEVVEKACDRLPRSAGAECRQFVTEYGPAVIALLLQHIDPASIYKQSDDAATPRLMVCPALGLCPQTSEVKKVDINGEQSICPLCMSAVEQLETMLKNNRTEDNIRHALDNLCNHLSTELRAQCVDFVDMYANEVVEMLVANMNAQEICVFLKLCKDKNSLKLKTPSTPASHGIDKFHEKPWLRGDMNHFREAKDHNDNIETNEIPDNSVNGREVKSPRASQVCDLCEVVTKDIVDQIKDKHNQDEIKQIVCYLLPELVRPVCDTYVDQIISLLATIDADEVCQALKLCGPSTGIDRARETNEIPDNSVNGREVKSPRASQVCDLCEVVTKDIVDQIKDKHNQDEIKQIVCYLVPELVRPVCDTYVDQIISLLATMDADEVCQALKLCGPSTGIDRARENNEIPDNTVNGREEKYPQASQVCVLCEVVTKEIVDQIKDKHNQDEIKQLVCNLIPESVRQECDTVVDLIISLLATGLDADKFCQELDLCDPSTGIDHARAAESWNCVVCETVLPSVKRLLTNEHIVEKFCGLLPAKYNARCLAMMKVYGENVVDLIEKIGVKGACQDVGLCATHEYAFLNMQPEHYYPTVPRRNLY